jgi:AraC-like DNA-binding protein
MQYVQKTLYFLQWGWNVKFAFITQGVVEFTLNGERVSVAPPCILAYAEGGLRVADASAVDEVLDYIHRHYTERITLADLCRRAYTNRTTLNRRFKARTRRSPMDYILHYRLNMACEMLTHSKVSVREIAEKTGFLYETYFTRVFKEKVGVTPTQYRLSEGFETLNAGTERIVEEF